MSEAYAWTAAEGSEFIYNGLFEEATEAKWNTQRCPKCAYAVAVADANGDFSQGWGCAYWKTKDEDAATNKESWWEYVIEAEPYDVTPKDPEDDSKTLAPVKVEEWRSLVNLTGGLKKENLRGREGIAKLEGTAGPGLGAYFKGKKYNIIDQPIQEVDSRYFEMYMGSASQCGMAVVVLKKDARPEENCPDEGFLVGFWDASQGQNKAAFNAEFTTFAASYITNTYFPEEA